MLSRENNKRKDPEAGTSLVGCGIREEGSASGGDWTGESEMVGRSEGFAVTIKVLETHSRIGRKGEAH